MFRFLSPAKSSCPDGSSEPHNFQLSPARRNTTQYNETVSVVALDIGMKFIGVAVSDPLDTIARPYRTITRTSLAQDVAELRQIFLEREADTVVVGFPRNMDGTIGPQVRKQEALLRLLEGCGLRICRVDERLSSIEAEQMMQQAGLKVQERNRRRDEFAAAIILQRYFHEGPV
jgi:putative Holliday junction resolvase